MLRGPASHVSFMHVVNVNLVLGASQLFDSLYSLFASLATGAENFDLVFHDLIFPFLPYFTVKPPSVGAQAVQDPRAGRRGHVFQTEARISMPTPT